MRPSELTAPEGGSRPCSALSRSIKRLASSLTGSLLTAVETWGGAKGGGCARPTLVWGSAEGEPCCCIELRIASTLRKTTSAPIAATARTMRRDSAWGGLAAIGAGGGGTGAMGCPDAIGTPPGANWVRY